MLLVAHDSKSLEWGEVEHNKQKIQGELLAILRTSIEKARIGYTADINEYRTMIPILYGRRDGRKLRPKDIAEILIGLFDNKLHAKMLDAYLRYIAFAVHASIKSRGPYDASAHPSDALDVSLVRALGIPAYVCTLDGRLRRRMAQAQAIHASQMVSFEELMGRLRTGSLKPLPSL